MTDPILDKAFSALADPTRRHLLTALLESDQTVVDLAAPFAMSLTAVSKHIGILIDAGLITQYREGRDRWCALNPAAMHEAFRWMQDFGYSEEQHDTALEAELTALGLIVDADS
jgi:DNA-binding transcriptional ArsR family regulator